MGVAREIIGKGNWEGEAPADRITLDHDARHRRRFHYVAEQGTSFLLDLPRPAVLQHGDALRLDDGRLIEIRAAPEALIEVTAETPADLVRLAWHIGNRHLAAELRPHAIRIREDHVIVAMLIGLGARVEKIRAPFAPESGAYHAH